MLFIDIIVWIVFSLFWIRITFLFTTKIISKQYLTWLGGLIWIFLMQREVWFIHQFLVEKGLPFYISILLLPLSFPLVWYIVTKKIRKQHITWIGGTTCLFVSIYLYFKVIQLRYPAVQWDSTISFLSLFFSLQSTFGRWLTQVFIPVSIPLSIAFLGWLSQKQQNEITKRHRNEEMLETYFNEMLELLPKINDWNISENTTEGELRALMASARDKTLSVFKNLKNYKSEKRRVLEFIYNIGALKNHEFSLLKDVNLKDLNLRNIHLEGANLSEANFSFSDFSFSNLSNTYLNKSYFSVCIFKEANLTNADCRFSCFNQSVFCGNMLFYGKHFCESFFASSKRSIRIEKTKSADLSNANFNHAQFYQANLEGVQLTNASMVNSNLKEANLSGANLTKADLNGADLELADFNNANLEGVNLTGTNRKDTKIDLQSLDH